MAREGSTAGRQSARYRRLLVAAAVLGSAGYVGAGSAGAASSPDPTLSVTVSGAGSVTSNDGQISCPSACSQSYKPGATVVLVASPSSGATFEGWSGDCKGTQDCSLTMDADHAVTATFVKSPGGGTTLGVSVSGHGTVSSTDGQISCTADCAQPYDSGAKVTLTASAPDGWAFVAWGGDCSGAKDCSVLMDQDRKVTASFLYAGLGDPTAITSEMFADDTPGGFKDVKLPALGKNLPPHALISGPTRVRSGGRVTLSGARSSDPDGSVVGYRWDLNDDGVYDDGFGPRVTFLAGRAGRQQVGLEVIDNDGRLDQAHRAELVHGSGAEPNVAAVLRHIGKPASLNGGFSAGVSGWVHAGSAFTGGVRNGKSIDAAQVLDTNGRVGGNYADGIAVPVGATGHWLTSFNATKPAHGLSYDAARNLTTGALVSRSFRLTAPYLNYVVGGGGLFGKDDERVELWSRAGSAWQRVAGLTRSPDVNEVMRPVSLGVKSLVGAVVAIAVIDASPDGHINVDQFGQSATPLPGASDHSYFRAPPATRADLSTPPPIVGFADFHSHPAAAQGFGALNGIRAYMGTVGGDVQQYDTSPGAYEHDVYSDDVYHFGGPMAKYGIDAAEGREPVASPDVAGVIDSLVGSHLHPRYGGRCVGPSSNACLDPAHEPGTLGPAHEQMNVYDIHRAWEGGLRLMSSLSINNSLLEYMGGFPHNQTGGPPESDIFGAPTEFDGDHSVNRISVTPESDVIQAQVEGMRELAGLNSSWMAIAYSPQQAYDIASSGRLAVILGTEIDTTGSLGFASASDEVDWLWGLGIRQVAPIHCCDSKIGGSALFQDAYNMANDFQNRPVKDITAIRAMDYLNDQGLALQPKAGFTGTPQVGYFLGAKSGCEFPNNARGECVNWRFDTPSSIGSAASPFGTQEVAVIDGNALTDNCCHVGFTVHPAPLTRIQGTYPYDHVQGGLVNTQGLTPYGAEYIRALMSHGMLIDMEHMSEATINAIIDPGTDAGHVAGPAWALDPNRPCSVAEAYNDRPNVAEECYRFAYPLMSSHTSYRAQSLLPTETTTKGFLSREFERSSDQLEYIRGSGGVVGPVVRQDPVHAITEHVSSASSPTWEFVDHRDWHSTSNPPNSCAGSSEGWAQAYLYSLQKMGGQGVGLGTDMLLVGGTSPRFGPSAPAHAGGLYACDASAASSSAWSSPGTEERVDPSQYQRSAQREPIGYGATLGSERYRAAFAGLPSSSAVMRAEVDPAGVTVNFNDEGMLRYGQLPDLLQDVRNIGVTPHDLAPLFNSAQAYVNMWDKAFTLAGCYGDSYSQCAGNGPAPLGNRVCHNTCPLDPGRGLLLAPDGTPYVLSVPAHH